MTVITALLAPPKLPSTRTYYPAWLRLRERREVTLRVAPHLVDRVKKAVIKEKDMDISFKFSHEGVGKRKLYMRSKYNSSSWELRLWLVECSIPSPSEL